ncbi:Vacuolar protein sorting-associated protein Ist1 [Dillenia turbinata]|uniref:Vacuolar protein sorting-associated protein Ist1 n=1 Tax=Dillenia turbinata TaxID=194707 RepID=A0AAN8V1R5_9MAGN
MGKKLDALLHRNFKTSRFKALVNLGISRVEVLKNKRQVRTSLARSDVVQLLNSGEHERALLRVEQVIREQNMLDVFAMIEGYCLLLVERVNLIEQDRECPEELKEAISSLLYAATRCGEFPELQEIRDVLTSYYGKEFAARAFELRNNCGVNPKMIQKLSTRQTSLESRMKVLREIASENNITMQFEEETSLTAMEKVEAQMPANSDKDKLQENIHVFSDEIANNDIFSDSLKAKKYRDVADAAQAAFESAAYAAAAARAAVELSRSEPQDPKDQGTTHHRKRELHDKDVAMKSATETAGENDAPEIEKRGAAVLGFEKIHPIQNGATELKGSTSPTNSDSEEVTTNFGDCTKQLSEDIKFDKVDEKRDESAKEGCAGENLLKSWAGAGLKEFGHKISGAFSGKRQEMPGAQQLNKERKPFSVGTKWPQRMVEKQICASNSSKRIKCTWLEHWINGRLRKEKSGLRSKKSLDQKKKRNMGELEQTKRPYVIM